MVRALVRVCLTHLFDCYNFVFNVLFLRSWKRCKPKEKKNVVAIQGLVLRQVIQSDGKLFFCFYLLLSLFLSFSLWLSGDRAGRGVNYPLG